MEFHLQMVKYQNLFWGEIRILLTVSKLSSLITVQTLSVNKDLSIISKFLLLSFTVTKCWPVWHNDESLQTLSFHMTVEGFQYVLSSGNASDWHWVLNSWTKMEFGKIKLMSFREKICVTNIYCVPFYHVFVYIWFKCLLRESLSKSLLRYTQFKWVGPEN